MSDLESQAMLHRVGHPKVQAQEAQHKMSSQATARQLLLQHHQCCPPPEQIKDTQVPRLKVFMKTTEIGL